MSAEKPRAPPVDTLNEEALKGIWLDGIGFHIGRDYVILEGIIDKPRAKKRVVVSRLIFPPRVLEGLIKTLTKVLEDRKRLEKEKP